MCVLCVYLFVMNYLMYSENKKLVRIEKFVIMYSKHEFVVREKQCEQLNVKCYVYKM